MMRNLLTASAFVGLAATLAPIASAQDSDWSGPYLGVGVGYSFKSDEEVIAFDTDRDGVFDDTVRTSTGADAFSPGFCKGAAIGASVLNGCRTSDGNTNLSVRAGYDLQFGNWVVGAVADYGAVSLGDDVSGFSTTPAASYTFTRDLNSLAAVRARGGWASNAGLLYATGGPAWADMDQTFTTTNTVNTFAPSGDSAVNGYQVGFGYEVKLDDVWLIGSGWSVGLEYLWTSLDNSDFEVAVSPGTAPATNPFLIVDPTGTDMRRTKDVFEYSTLGFTLNWRP